MSTIILTGGGTAGHIMPNIALLPELKKHFENIYYFGGNGIEKNIAEKNGLIFIETDVIKFNRNNLFSNVKIPTVLKKGIAEAKKKMEEIQPNIVFSKGGYAALPACFAAKKLNIPVVCHESDYTMGLANKLVSKFAKKTLTSFPETQNGIFVGNPIREEFYTQRTRLCLPCFDSHKRTILVCGGSLGAAAINSVIYKALPILLKSYNIIHISGNNGNFNIKENNYFQSPYLDNFPAALRSCNIIVCRAGANTLSESAALGKPCVTIPLPKGTSRGDQILNAESFAKRGFCKILQQENLNVDSLVASIKSVENETPPKSHVSEINKNIVNHIISVIK